MIISQNIQSEISRKTHRGLYRQVSRIYIQHNTSGRICLDEYMYLEITPIWFTRCLYLARTLTHPVRLRPWIEMFGLYMPKGQEKLSVFFSHFVSLCFEPPHVKSFVQMVI